MTDVADWARALGHHLLGTDLWLIGLAWLLTLLGTVLTYFRLHPAGARGLAGFAAFCLPPDLVRHRSYRLDLWFVLAGRLIRPLVLGPLLIGSTALATGWVRLLASWFGPHPAHPPGWTSWLLLLGLIMLARDFVNFAMHYLLHKNPLLWELHKVHHSAERLMPLSNRRVHPWQEVVEELPANLAVGTLVGPLAYGLGLDVQDAALTGVDAYFVANLLTFYHLRHSHIPMSFGWLERWLVSPAQHQLHHSTDPRHWDRNFGGVLICWDRLFGTFLPAEPNTRLCVGLHRAEQLHYDTVAKLYLTPLRRIGARGARWLVRVPGGRGTRRVSKPAATANISSIPGGGEIAVARGAHHGSQQA
jgi:sterol desaturase/sphingolipid hydroxylase (fatty acid hydroxylase superfamily)